MSLSGSIFEVSIPYRLATNLVETSFKTSTEFLFQFLIGWLQTLHICPRALCGKIVSIPYRLATNELKIATGHILILTFQFLIGWLQTVSSKNLVQSILPFQFLIGWLQTCLGLYSPTQNFGFNSL